MISNPRTSRPAHPPAATRKAADEPRDSVTPLRQTAETIGLKRVLERERKRAPQS